MSRNWKDVDHNNFTVQAKAEFITDNRLENPVEVFRKVVEAKEKQKNPNTVLVTSS